MAVADSKRSSGRGRNKKIENVYLGTGYGDAEIERALEASGFKWQRSTSIDADVAAQVAAGKIVARFTGRMEYGPRALCHRSSGSFARHVMTTRSSAAGVSGCRLATGGGVSFKMAPMRPACVLPSKALRPVSIS